MVYTVYTIYAWDKIHKTTHEATPNIHWIIVCPRKRTPFHLSVRFHLSSGGYSLPGGVVCVCVCVFFRQRDLTMIFLMDDDYISHILCGIWLVYVLDDYTIHYIYIYCIQYVDRYTYIQNSTPTFKPLLFNIRIDIGFLPGYLLLHPGSNIRWKLPTDTHLCCWKGHQPQVEMFQLNQDSPLLYRSKTSARSNLASEALWKDLLVIFLLLGISSKECILQQHLATHALWGVGSLVFWLTGKNGPRVIADCACLLLQRWFSLSSIPPLVNFTAT